MGWHTLLSHTRKLEAFITSYLCHVHHHYVRYPTKYTWAIHMYNYASECVHYGFQSCLHQWSTPWPVQTTAWWSCPPAAAHQQTISVEQCYKLVKFSPLKLFIVEPVDYVCILWWGTHRHIMYSHPCVPLCTFLHLGNCVYCMNQEKLHSLSV